MLVDKARRVYVNVHVPLDCSSSIHGDELLFLTSQGVHDHEASIMSDEKRRWSLPMRLRHDFFFSFEDLYYECTCIVALYFDRGYPDALNALLRRSLLAIFLWLSLSLAKKYTKYVHGQ